MEHVMRYNLPAPYWKSYEPFLDENRSNAQGHPTLITRGVFSGYSLPVWNSNDEELYFRMRVPFRWDGITAPWFVAITAPVGVEDIGDKYKFQLEWASKDVGAVIPDSVTETLTDEIVIINTAAYYANIIQFEFNSATIVSGQNIQGRLRRIASGIPAVSNEIALFHWCTRWKMDKVGTNSTQGY